MRDKPVHSLIMHGTEILSQRLEELMTGMFHIMLIVGVIHYTLQVAFVVTHFVCQFKNILFHYFSSLSFVDTIL